MSGKARVFLIATALMGLEYGGLACAAESGDLNAEVSQSRFAVDDVRFRAHPERASVDGRFRVQSRLQAPPAEFQNGSALEVRAKLELAGATLCATGGGELFADSFE